MTDLAHFDRIMKSYYRNRYEKVSETNRNLFDLAIFLVRQIHDAESDGSSITSLKEAGDRACEQLRQMVEKEQAP